jgi:iron-sulfur cluster assembly accessory protein
MDKQIKTVEATEEFVLTVTDLAAIKIQSILQERNVPDYGLRLFVAGMGCSGPQYGLALEQAARDDDQVLETGGVKVFVDAVSAEYLSGATIDYVEGPAAGGFRIDNPNVVSSCGSGGCNGCH